MNLDYFKNLDNFYNGLQTLFNSLNIPVNYIDEKPLKPEDILLKISTSKNKAYKLMDDVYILGMVDDKAFEGRESIQLSTQQKQDAFGTIKLKKDYDGILIFGVTLKEKGNGLLPTRSQLAEVTRAFNREFHYTPVVVVFRYGNYISLANAERLKYKQEWREGEKTGKISILRDVEIENPHTGHLKILEELKITRSGKKGINTFEGLYQYWQEVFSVNLLNKKFYTELSNWYFWAIKHVKFPSESQYVDEQNKQYKAQNIIRMLTRLLFVWFIKEKKLIPEELFDLENLQSSILKKIEPEHFMGQKKENTESIYYKAILQNLFFATLNCPVKPDSIDSIDSRKRGFRGNESYGKHRGVDYLMRYKKYFKDPDAFLDMVNKVVPFLNGGLFECLDDKEKKIYIDGFSDNMSKTNGEINTLVVPDYLFFGHEEKTDLSSDLGVKNKGTKEASVKGLINILKSYKFTIAENTPIEEDVALDPEFLGKVFENLLASYNPETKAIARKQTGSFYTPREIVNYMVDESLIAHLKNSIGSILLPGLNSIGSILLPGLNNSKQDTLNTFLNPNDEINITHGNLPHWTQDDSWYFVTFRLADSIPEKKIKRLKQEREQWLKNHRNNSNNDYTKEDMKEYYQLFSGRVEGWMNAGYGNCVLKDKTNVKIIADAIKYFEGKRYELDEWVIMPNHVHILVKPLKDNKLGSILHSWKSFTANKINKNIKSDKQLWMHESYDHIVRHEKAFNAIKKYIRENPQKAGVSITPEASSIVLKASSFKSNIVSKASNIVSKASNIVSKASSFKDVETQKQDAFDTMLRQLVSFEPVNPFENDTRLSQEIIHSLDNCKILDPACGSGAFPMGILQKMVHILQKVDPDNEYWQDLQLKKAQKATEGVFVIKDKEEKKQLLDEINEAFDQSINNPDYARKLFLIENCIYGVDIQPIAAQISKLRFFISLVVEQKVNKEKDNFGIRPLPNLETKFVTANTLIGIDKPDGELFYTKEVQEKEAELKAIRHKLFGAKTKATKVKYRKKDEELRNEIADFLKKGHLPVESAEQLASWDPYDQNGVSPFFDPEWMFDIKDGFDVVIGNPPYVQIQKFSGQKCQKDWQNQNYKTFVKTGDIYSLFYEKGNMVLQDGGILAYITLNKWMRANYGKKTRKYFTEYTHPLKLIDFGGYKVFESATVDTNILIFAKKENQLSQNQRTAIACTIGKDFNPQIDIDSYLKENGIEFTNLSEESWIISSKAEYKIKKRIEEIGTPLKEWDISIYRGVLTGFNKAFIIDGAKKDELIAKDPKSADIIKPILRGRDIKRYKAKFADLWLIATFPALDLNIDNYPAVKKHLESFGKRIEQTGETGSRKKTNNEWFETQDQIGYYKEFEKEKVVWKRIGSVIRFSYSQQGELCLDSTVIATGKDVKYLSALLNSKLHIKELIDNSPKTGTGDAIISVQALEPLLVHKPSQKIQLLFEILVDCILFAKENNMKTEADTFESVIDGMVYDLYFEDEMKNANCYITDRISEVVKPFKEDDSNEFKKEYIEKLHTFCRNDKTIFRGLIHRRNVKVVKIISGETK